MGGGTLMYISAAFEDDFLPDFCSNPLCLSKAAPFDIEIGST
jgi:hypothetical protein